MQLMDQPDKENGSDKGDPEPLDVPHTIEEVIEQTMTLGDHKSEDNGKAKH